MQRYGSGAILIVLGLALAWKSLDYRIGVLARMGPGFFPLMLGVVLAVLGLLILVLPEDRTVHPVADTGRTDGTDRKGGADGTHDGGHTQPAARSGPRRGLRPWLGVVLAFAAFVVFGRYGGLIPATFATVLIAALADRDNGIAAALGLAAAVTVFSVLVFHYLIHLQLPLFGWR